MKNKLPASYQKKTASEMPSNFKRKAMSKSESRKDFTKHASETHKKNLQSDPMRGGIRL